MPSSVQQGTGELQITTSFSVAVTGTHDASLESGAQRFSNQLSQITGISFRANTSGAPTLEVHADHGREAVQKLGEDESYELTVTGAGAKITAPTPLGALHGVQTFLQLVQIGPNGFAVPAVTIKDQPRFPWRGLLIDVSRHFIPIDVLKRNLDGMAAVKMNVLHWHLSDDQGFRAESKKFPKLTSMGSEAKLILERRGVPPLLLLDDVLSELDSDRRRILAERVLQVGQTLITATEPSALPVEPAQLLRVSPGVVQAA